MEGHPVARLGGPPLFQMAPLEGRSGGMEFTESVALLTLLEAFFDGDLIGSYAEDEPHCPVCGSWDISTTGSTYSSKDRLGHKADCGLWLLAKQHLPEVLKAEIIQRRKRRERAVERVRGKRVKQKKERARANALEALGVREGDLRDILVWYRERLGVYATPIESLGRREWDPQEFKKLVDGWKADGSPRDEEYRRWKSRVVNNSL